MHAVVNRLPLKPETDWSALAAKFAAFEDEVARQSPAFRGLSLIRADNEAILIVLFETRAALDDVSRNVAAPWFAEHVRPHLAGPVMRTVGEVLAGSLGMPR